MHHALTHVAVGVLAASSLLLTAACDEIDELNPFAKQKSYIRSSSQSQKGERAENKQPTSEQATSDNRVSDKPTDDKPASDKPEAAEQGTKAEPEPRSADKPVNRVYAVEQICDCVYGQEIILESVELTAEHTIITLLNATRREIDLYPPGHASAQFLLEWRYMEKGRPRHDLLEIRGAEAHPQKSRPVRFQLVFPRISDQAQRIQLSGQRTKELDYYSFTTVHLNNELPLEEWRRQESHRTCGFDGPSQMAAGATHTAEAHVKGSSIKWTARGASIVGNASGQSVKIQAEREGKAELCLRMRRGGDTCSSCQDIEVQSGAARAPDFAMTSCGGLPSRAPHWRFSAREPASGTSYEWSIGGKGNIIDSKSKPIMTMRPSPRPGPFTVTLTAKSGGKSTSYTRTYHSVYSCQEPPSR